jgi:hypothetical protein
MLTPEEFTFGLPSPNRATTRPESVVVDAVTT